jgi:hypothetical protein
MGIRVGVDILGTPPSNDTCKENLFRVVCYIWAKSIDDTSKMAVGTH